MKLLRYIFNLIAFMLLGASLFTGFALIVEGLRTEKPKPKPVPIEVDPAEYARGVNNALDHMALLALEQQVYMTNRTWGEMSEIVAKRLHVERKMLGVTCQTNQ